MKRYQEMTTAEKDATFGTRHPSYHVYWVLADGQPIGYVYQIPMERAGSLWRATSATMAWMACHHSASLATYFPSKALAAAAVVTYEKRIKGAVA